MNILVLTTLYPNNIQHRHGIFIENRVKELVKRYPEAKVKVIAPVPYFPSWLPIGGYRQYSNVVEQEVRAGLDIYHPKYFVVPKVGMNITPYFLYHSALKAITELQQNGFKVDVIDSHYFYPDGVVANWIGKKLNIPVMITARGSDINLIPQNKIARKRIIKALTTAEATAAVSQALANEMVKLAPAAKPPVVLRNGVDLELFNPEATKPALPFTLEGDEKLVLSVGNLVELKGHHLVIEAVSRLEKVKLVIIGEGQQKQALQKQVADLSLADRVYFTGNVLQTELPGYYATADVLVLASSREGMPNVLLESIACGTPVVATNVGGSAEVITQNNIGVLLNERSAKSIEDALSTIFIRNTPHEVIRLFSQQLSWESITANQFSHFNSMIENNIEIIE